MKKHNVHSIVGLLLSATILTGCEMQAHVEQQTKQDTQAQSKQISTYVEMVTLDDGTRCVYLWRGGIDCDWKDATPHRQDNESDGQK